MSNIKQARVDNRYIHGQVSARLVREFNISKILLVSDAYAVDPFMAELYQAMAIGFTVDVVSVADAAVKWNAGAYATEPAVLLLWGSIRDAAATFQAGLRFDALSLANIPGEPGRVRVNNSCYVNAEEVGQLRTLAGSGVEVVFQAMTDMPRTTLEEAMKLTGL